MRFQKCADSCGRDCLRGIGIVVPFKIGKVEPPLMATPPQRPLFFLARWTVHIYISSYLNLSTMAERLLIKCVHNCQETSRPRSVFSSVTEEKVRNGHKNLTRRAH